MKLLLVEDDSRLADHLKIGLRDQGFNIDHATCKEDLDQSLKYSDKIDFILMDRLLGAFDSKIMLPQIRKKWPTVPILILSAISTPNERAELINLGADDYLGKPFGTAELLARIRALIRRTSTPVGGYHQLGNLIIDSIKRIISVGEVSESIPAKEFLLLRALSQDTGKVWSKNDLLDYVWGQASEVDTNVVEATMANVRKKLTDIGATITIKNMRNTGYWIEI